MTGDWFWMSLEELRLFREWLASTSLKANQEQSELSQEHCGCQESVSSGTTGGKKLSEAEVDEHWKWVIGLLDATAADVDRDWWDTCEYLYKTALQHGYKHAIEDLNGSKCCK